MSPSSPPSRGVRALRIDTALRAKVAADPTPHHREALATLLIQHHAAREGLALLPATGSGALRWAAQRQLGADRGPVDTAALRTDGRGRDAFLVALHAGEEAAAEAIAERTGGAEGTDLRAELALRRGQPPAGALSPLNTARRSFLAGELAVAADQGRAVDGPDRAEGALVATAALRRLGRVEEARSARGVAERAPGPVLPGVALERALLRLVRASLQLRGSEDISAIRWAYGGRPVARSLWPRIRWMRWRLEAFSRAVGAFRGEVLTRCVEGRVVPVVDADVPRARAAHLRTALQVQSLDTVLARFDRLSERFDGDYVVGMYAAEVLHWAGRHEAAGARCAAALATDPTSRWSWIGLLQAQMWTGQLGAARRTLHALQARHPHLPTIPAVEGELLLHEGRASAALPLLRAALDHHPTRWSAHVVLGLAQARCGQPSAAAGTLRRLRALAPAAFLAAPDRSTEAVLADHLARLRGNRSSGFVTLVAPDGSEQLLMRSALSGLQAGPVPG